MAVNASAEEHRLMLAFGDSCVRYVGEAFAVFHAGKVYKVPVQRMPRSVTWPTGTLSYVRDVPGGRRGQQRT